MTFFINKCSDMPVSAPCSCCARSGLATLCVTLAACPRPASALQLTESLKVERASKIIRSNCHPNTPMSPNATSTRVLNPSRDGDSTTALGSLCQCLTTLSVKKFFLVSNPNLGSWLPTEQPCPCRLSAPAAHPTRAPSRAVGLVPAAVGAAARCTGAGHARLWGLSFQGQGSRRFLLRRAAPHEPLGLFGVFVMCQRCHGY